VDEGAFPEDDLADRDALLALLFRSGSSPDPGAGIALNSITGRASEWNGVLS
jgi:hypothetical protein